MRKCINYSGPLLFAALVLLLNSCDRKKEEIPSYISIDKITVQQNSLNEGVPSDNITDAWVYLNDNFFAVYELPVTFPILTKDVKKVEIRAGIKRNGLTNNRLAYPFYEGFIKDTSLEEGRVLKLNPLVKYSSLSNFLLVEDFEDAGLRLVESPNNDGEYKISNEPGKIYELYGSQASGLLIVPSNGKAEIVAVDSVIYPRGGVKTMLEINYRCNIPFVVGFYADTKTEVIQTPVVTVKASPDEWKKIYIDFSDDASALPAGSFSRLFIGAFNNSGTPQDVFIDNVKLITFK